MPFAVCARLFISWLKKLRTLRRHAPRPRPATAMPLCVLQAPVSYGEVTVLNNKKKATNAPYMRKDSLLASLETTFAELTPHENFVHHNTQASHAEPRSPPKCDLLGRPSTDPFIHNPHYPTCNAEDTFVLRDNYEMHAPPIANKAIVKLESDKGQQKTHFSQTVANSRNPNSRLSCKVDAYFRYAPDTYADMKVAFLDHF